ncbi:MAG: MFS family permease, partial [Arenicella sp.]
MARYLLSEKRFLPYFCTQFLGAFNDNIYRNALAIIVTYVLAKENQAIIINVALVAFILPYFLFGALAGQLADKYEKSWLIRKIKIAEIVIMCLGSVALYLQSMPMMLFILFALGSQSAFFGPIKYSILPQHLHPDEILSANAYVESGTFVAILIGTILGGFLGGNIAYLHILIGGIIVVAALGWWVSRGIPSAPAAAPDLKISLNLVRSSIEIIRMARADKPVFMSILAISWFWFFGSIVLTQFPVFAKDVLSGNANVATLLLATFSIGIALGSFTCSKLSGAKVEIGLVPFGALGMSFFAYQLGRAVPIESAELLTLAEIMLWPGAWWVVINLTMIAFSAGLFIVPLYAFLQTRSDASQRSRVIAVNNIYNSIFMVTSGVLGMLMFQFGFNVLQIFKVAAVLNLIATIYIIAAMPEYFLRLVSWLLVHSIYRVKKENLANIPKQGPALLVCNHVAFIDPAVLLGVIPRPARFVMWYGFYELPVVGRLFKWLNSIPIGNGKQRPELVPQAFDTIAQALANGELVVVFPEGGITRNGEMAKFQ